MSEIFPGVKQISQTGNEMYGQGGFPVGIHTTDAGWLADPADTMLLAGRDPVIKEVSVGMTGEEAAVYDVSGTPPLSLPNSLGKPLKAWEVGVLPKQDLNGYANPWPAGGGINKLDYNSIELLTLENNASRYGMQYTDAGTYAINSYSTGTTAYIYTRIKNSDDTWLAAQYIVAGTSVTGKIITITSGQTLYVFDSVGNHTMSEAKAVMSAWSIQVALSSTQPEQYYPYENLCPIHGTDKLNVFVEESYDQSATPKAVLTLPQTVYTGTVGSGGGESSTEELDLATIDSTRWRFGAALNDGTGYYVYITGTVSNPTTMISDRYVRTSGGAWEALSFGQFMATTYLIITVPNECSTLESARDYLINTNKPQFVMSLSTPTEFALSTPTIPTPRGTATTWATAEDGTVDSMSVSYVGGL